MHLQGEEQFERPIEEVWQRLSDPGFLCQCFPGVDAVAHTNDRSAAFRVRPGFSFVRGTLDISFEFVEKTKPTQARVAIHVRGIGSSAELESQFILAPTATGTQVTWTADSRSFGGLLKAVSGGLMQGAAQKVAAETWTNIRKQL